ncbi:hypothetical protein [Mesorhizobium sp.]|uniref:hypothetical protein n=1 Tax=Mesorhizobium sp. TaxID=1871066 RepID=UPI000FE7D25F|nr:hypothetical protein [Mesorhizobium sp.]RWB66580.1 MAG: hypothetical protein EOQ49_28220 [Mesorhizobium sp.]
METTAGSVKIDIGGNLAPFEAALAKARQMADLFDQQVSKKLGNTGASEAGLTKIAGLIEQTNALLMKMTGTVNTADASMNKFGTDAGKASAAVDDVRSSASGAAPAVGKLSSEFDGAATSIQRAVAANQQFAASNRALAAASNLKLADGSAASVEEMNAFAVALDDIRAKYNPLFKVTRDYLALKDELRIATKLGALSEGEASAALSTARRETLATIGVIKGHSDALNDHGRAAGLDATRIAALMHAVRSFGEQIALGVSPLQAMTGQMNHLSYIASGSGGLSGALGAIGNMALSAVTRFARVGAAVAGVAIGFEYIRDQASETEKRTVGFGETAIAIFQVLRDNIRNTFGPALAVVLDPLIYAFKQLGSAAVDIAEVVINSFHAAFVDIKVIWAALPDSFRLTFAAAANFGIDTLNLLIKKSSDAVDQIITIFNRLGANIPLLNAGKQTIEPIDTKPYMDSLDKLVADRNAKIKEIMSSTPLRDFGQQVVDKIQTNHALEGLDALANVDFGKSIGGATQLGNAVGGIGSNASGVTVTIGGMAQQVINVTRAFEDAKRAQLGQLTSAQMNLVQMKQQVTDVQQRLAALGQQDVSKVFGSFFSNTAAARQAIADAASGVDNLFKQWDAGRESATALNADIEKVRQTLLAMGGDPHYINDFLNEIVNSQLQVRQLKSNVDSLSQSIRAIPNRTVTITVKTQRIGSGTMSSYDVQREDGSGSTTVGVTRYGGDGSTSGPSITANQVPRSGSGSMGGSADNPGSTNVNVYRFATGGVIHPGDTQQVSFFKSPDETVAIFTPQQRAALAEANTGTSSAQSTMLANALADAQSGFTGAQPTKEDDRLWTVLMNVEANTRKTAQILDDIKTSMASSSSVLSSGGSSYSGSNTAEVDPQRQAYYAALRNAMANYAAIGGRAPVGYGLGGLAASARQIAYNQVYGGMSPVGSAGSTSYERDMAADYSNVIRSVFRGVNNLVDANGAPVRTYAGFASGGIIGGDSGDTQKVEFFKNPDEKVIIARPNQFQDVRQQPAAANSNASSGDRPLIGTLSMPIYIQSGAQASKDSIAELKRQATLAVREAIRGINGRS